MLSQRLIAAIGKLSAEEKEEVRALLQEQPQPQPSGPAIGERFQVMLRIMQDVTGKPLDMVSREEPMPILRAIIADALAEEGYTYKDIMEQMGKDRSTFYRLRYNLDLVRRNTRAWEREYKALTKFTEKLKDYDKIHEGADGCPGTI